MSGPPYEELWVHRLMLRDSVRTEAYRTAIAKTVRADDVVLDVGAGTGILGLFAVQAGARRVYAVERTETVELARHIVRGNGASDRIEVIQGDMGAVELPEKVDVLVSEWMGGYGVDEYMHVPVFVARDQWLKPGGAMLPQRVTTWMAPTSHPGLDEGLQFWRSRPYNVNLNLIADGTAQEVFSVQHDITEETLLAEPQPLWTIDCLRCSVEDARGPFTAALSFQAMRDGRLSALAAWFHAELAPDTTLTNAPHAPKTHWGRWAFPCEQAIDVHAGTRIDVQFACEPADSGDCHNRWSIRLGGGSWEDHNTRTRSSRRDPAV